MNGGDGIQINTYVIEVITAAIFWYLLIQMPKRNTEIYNGDFILAGIHIMTLVSLSIYNIKLVAMMSEMFYIIYFYRLSCFFRQYVYKKERICIGIGVLFLILLYIFTTISLTIVLLITVLTFTIQEVRASTNLFIGSIFLGLLTTLGFLQTFLNYSAGDTYWVLRVLAGVYSIVCVLNIFLKIMRSTYAHSITDLQTGVYNQTKIHQIINKMWPKDQVRLFLIYVSLDNPFSSNLEDGGTEEDRVLRSTAKILKSEIEPFGYVGRQKGLEFIAVVSNCDARSLAEGIRKRITEEVVHTNKAGEVQPVSISIGICERFDGWSMERNLNYVVKAMVTAKVQGANQVVQLKEELSQH